MKRVQLAFRRVSLTLLAAAIVVTIRLLLNLAGYRRIRKIIPRARRGYAPRTMSYRIVAAVRSVARGVPRATCLTQALSVQLLLALRGYTSEVRIGVARRPDGRFDAHAWVVSADEIIIGGAESEIADYQPLMTLTN